MPAKRDITPEMEAFLVDLRRRVRLWIADEGLKQREAADRLGIQLGMLSSNIGKHRFMSEDFIAILQEKMPRRFVGVLDRYRELKYTDSLPPQRKRSAVAKAKEREHIIKLEEQLLELVHELARRRLETLDEE